MHKKNNKNKKNSSNDLDIQQIVSKTNDIIDRLEFKKNKIFFNKKRKKLILSQIQNLKQNLLDEQYYVLKNKIDALEKIEKEDKKLFNQKNKVKFSLSLKNIKTKFKEINRIPIYSRFVKIIQNDTGKNKYIKLSFLCLIIFGLISIILIGFFLVFNIIPYNISQDSTKIGPWIIISLPLAILFFI